MIRAVDNEAATSWTQTIGDVNTDTTKSAYSVGFSVIQVSISIRQYHRYLDISTVYNNCVHLQGSSALYAGLGLWQAGSSVQAPAVVALDPSTGAVQWTTVLGAGQAGHGGVR